MPRISLTNRLNSASRMSTASDEYKPMVLDYDFLVPSKDNFYPADDLEELADNMLLCGHIEPIIVGRVDDKDRIISGHRRYYAIGINIQKGHTGFKKVNCMIRSMSDPMFRLALLSANAFTRKLDDATLVRQASELKTVLRELADSGEIEIQGRMRDYLADTLGVSGTKMAQVDKITSSLVPEGKEALESGKMNFSKAYETSRLPAESQRMVIEDESLLSADVREMVRGMNITCSVSESDTEEENGLVQAGEVLHERISLPEDGNETGGDNISDGVPYDDHDKEDMSDPEYTQEDIVEYVRSGIYEERRSLALMKNSGGRLKAELLRQEAIVRGFEMMLEMEDGFKESGAST